MAIHWLSVGDGWIAVRVKKERLPAAKKRKHLFWSPCRNTETASRPCHGMSPLLRHGDRHDISEGVWYMSIYTLYRVAK